MKIKNSILIIGIFILIAACKESVEEKALREFSKELDAIGKEWDKEKEGIKKQLVREIDKW